MPKIVAIIQARMGSSRLPGKSLLPLAGKPLVAHVINRTRAIARIDAIVLATCHGEENNELIALANTMEVHAFRGSVDDVLERYYLAALKYKADVIVRITGDNPFLDPEYAARTIELALQPGVDLCSIINLPLGVAVETISRCALERAYRESDKNYQREHVSPYIKEHPELFPRIEHSVIYHNPFPTLRLTVDTDEDYAFAGIVYDNLYKEDQLFKLADIIAFIERHPEYAQLNAHIVQRSMTHSANPQ